MLFISHNIFFPFVFNSVRSFVRSLLVWIYFNSFCYYHHHRCLVVSVHIFRTFYFIDSLCGWMYAMRATQTNRRNARRVTTIHCCIKFEKLCPMHCSRIDHDSRENLLRLTRMLCVCFLGLERERWRVCVYVCIWPIVCFVLYKLCWDDVAPFPTTPRPTIQPDFQLPLCWRLCLFSLLSAFNYMHLYALYSHSYKFLAVVDGQKAIKPL